MPLNYSSYEGIIRSFLRRDIALPDLCVKLLSSALDSEDVPSMEPVRTRYHSQYRNEKDNISSTIKAFYNGSDGKSEEETQTTVKRNLEDRLIQPYLKAEREHVEEMLKRFARLVDGDAGIPDEIKKKFLALSAPETFSDFLAATLIYAVQQKNDAKKTTSKRKIKTTQSVDALSEEPLPSETSQQPQAQPPSVSKIILFSPPSPSPSPKRRKKIIIVIAAVAVLLIPLTGFGIWALGYFSHNIDANVNTDFDRHILLKIDNAAHQYEMGLNNWRRLEYTKAEDKITEALEALSKYEGQAEMDIARMNNSLGCLYLDMGKYEEAGQLLNSAYLAFRKSYNDKSIEVRAVKASLAQYDFYTGNYDRALKETDEIIEISNRKRDKAVIATTSHFRANVLNSLGRHDEALANYEQVLSLYEGIKKHESQSMDLARYTNDSSITDRKREYYKTAKRWIVLSYANMGATHLMAGDAQAAHTELSKALENCRKTWFIGQKTLMTADIYCNLAMAKQQLGDTRGALSDAETAIAIQRGLFDYTDDYAGLAISYRVLAGIQSAIGSETALETYQKSLELALRDYGEHHPQTALSCQALGVFYLEQDDFEQALEYLERALDIRKNILLTNNTDTLALYQYLQQASKALGEQGKEQAYANEARALEEAMNV
jgi:tetratricopeptide (TPR) repeat protein